jgi:hypothetical protein
MKAKVSVTFEFTMRPPLTWRGEFTATGAQTIVSRAVRDAKRALKPNNWQSLVVVILERDNTAETDETEEEEQPDAVLDAQ